MVPVRLFKAFKTNKIATAKVTLKNSTNKLFPAVLYNILKG